MNDFIASKFPVSNEELNEFYKEGYLEMNLDCSQNKTFIIESNNAAGLARYNDGRLLKLPKEFNFQGFQPRDAQQKFAADALLTEDVKLITILGAAGTGKTSIAMAYALEALTACNKKILLTKPAIHVGAGKAFGPIPGDISEKYAPYLESFETILKKIMGERGKNYLQMMLEKEQIQFKPLEFVRGCNFEDAVFIIDEAQNLTWHEINTLISRCADTTKIIVLGDLTQIDTKSSQEETGLYKLVNSKTYLDSKLTATILLTKQYRSKITELMVGIDAELRETATADTSIGTTFKRSKQTL